MLRSLLRAGLLAAVVLALVTAGHAADRPARTAAVTAPPPAPGVHLGSFHSAALRGTDHYAIYLPHGYGRTGRRYPVVFLLHGLPAGPAAYRNPRVGDLGRIAERHGTPAIVVAAQGARAGDSDPEWHDWGPGRDWETATSAELVRTIDARYRTIADPRSRALIGISAGGYGAALIGLHHPEIYAVIQSWSGYFHPTTPDGHAPLDVGTDRDNLLAGAHSYVGCLARLAPADRPRLFGFYVGDRDSRFLPENRQLDAELRRAGVPHLFRVYRGSHSDAVWDAHEEAWLRAALARLDTTPPADGLDPQQRRQAAQRAGCPLA